MAEKKVKEEDEAKLPAPAEVAGALTDLEDLGEYEGRGTEDVSVDELAPPFIEVLQSNTPIVKKGPQHLAGAEEGMLYNKASGRLYDGEKGVPFVPVQRSHVYLEYYPRAEDGSGGGFVREWSPDDPVVEKLRKEHGKFGKLPYSDEAGRETEINEAYVIAGWFVPDWDMSQATRVIVTFASTKIKGYKKFMSLVTDELKYWLPKAQRYVKPPLWAHRFILRTEFVQKGTQSWYVMAINLAETPKERSYLPKSHPLFQLGAGLSKQFETGEMKIDHSKSEADIGGEGGSDVPF